MPMVAKGDRVLTYNEELPPIKLHDLLVTWSCEVKIVNALNLHLQKTMGIAPN